jgi:hypothetical protein
MISFHYVVFFVLLVVVTRSEEDLYAHGPFGKAHLKVKIPSPFNSQRPIGIFHRSVRSLLRGTTDIHVSTTLYFNGDQIGISWTPSSAPCQDDFIGLYFPEIPIETGIKSSHIE